MSEVVAYPLGSAMLAPVAPGVSNGPGRTHGELRQELEEWAVAQPSITRCAWCDWAFEGTVAEGAAASKEHRVEVHGVTAEARRRMRSRSGKSLGISFGNNDLAENLAKVRMQGGARFDVDEPEERGAPDEPEVAPVDSAADEREEDPVAAPAAKRTWTPALVLDEIRAYAREHGHPPTATASSTLTSAAKHYFGGWANAVEAAGFPRPTRGTRAPRPAAPPAPEPIEATPAEPIAENVPPPAAELATPAGTAVANGEASLVDLAVLHEQLDHEISRLTLARSEVAAAMRERIGDR